MDGQTIIFKSTDFEEISAHNHLVWGRPPLPTFGQCQNIINLIFAEGFPVFSESTWTLGDLTVTSSLPTTPLSSDTGSCSVPSSGTFSAG